MLTKLISDNNTDSWWDFKINTTHIPLMMHETLYRLPIKIIEFLAKIAPNFSSPAKRLFILNVGNIRLFSHDTDLHRYHGQTTP